MAGYTGSSQLSNTLPKFIEEARLTLSQVGAVKNAVTTIPLKKGEGLTLNMPTWSQPTAYTLTEGVDMQQAQQISDSNIAITVAENAGVQVLFTKLAMDSIRENALRMAARQMANAVENKRGDDLVTLLDGLSTTIGSAGTSLVIGHIMAGKVRIKTATRPPEGPIHAVFHPYQLHSLYSDLAGLSSGAVTYPNATGMAENTLSNYEVFDVAGVKIFSDALIPADGSDDGKGGIFAQAALIYVPYEEESIEEEYDSSARATEVNMVATYGYGEYFDSWGFEMLFDQASPTV